MMVSINNIYFDFSVYFILASAIWSSLSDSSPAT